MSAARGSRGHGSGGAGIDLVRADTGPRAVRLSPAELAEALGRPAPTPEQAAVIAAPLAPGVVVAGAGSGKTETMAARVVWLVANGWVRPEQVLGLTFTRKAARELGVRIRQRLSTLAHRRVVDPAVVVGEATVATYDAYAGGIVAAHATRVGREPGARLVTQASAWQYANDVVQRYDGPMDAVAHTPGTVVEQVLALHGEMTGHLVGPEQVRRFTTRLRTAVDAVPAQGRTGRYAAVTDILARAEHREALLPLVEEFRARKTADDVVDFADRAELAARLAEAAPEIGATERATYGVVLLDEYQDTSHAQLVLLRALFGTGHPVTAVGDPCQSIYAWRGASAGTLAAFRHQFAADPQHPTSRATLSTSFRNTAAVLAVANRVAEPLRRSGADVPVLSPFRPGVAAGPDAAEADLPAGTDPGSAAGAPGSDGATGVTVAWHRSATDEAADVARRARAAWDRSGGRPTVAVLVRSRAQIPLLDTALRAVDLPVEIAELGGLLSTPEVADVVAALQVVADPSRGDALMRLLSGPRWRLGPRDLRALGSARGRGAEAVGTGADVVVSADDVDGRSIVDVLDELGDRRPRGLSTTGWVRARALATELRRLRRRTGVPLPDLVLEIERTVGIGVEVEARRGPAARVQLDRFRDVAADFVTASARATGTSTVAAFVAYLDAAVRAERGLDRSDAEAAEANERPEDVGEVEVSTRAVQILTVHGAKGLEWDVVFVPGLGADLFPARPRSAKAWLGDPGALPYPLRGDAAALPHWDVAAAADQKQLRDAADTFRRDVAEQALRDERRLAYVAVTRARAQLVCSGHAWTPTRQRPVAPSPFLEEIREVCEQGAGEVALWVADVGEENPQLVDRPELRWPFDPLGDRSGPVREAARLVEVAATDPAALIAGLGTDADAVERAGAEWSGDIDALLAERERSRAGRVVEVVLPDRLSVSSLVRLREDPAALARSLRRPLPHRPAPAARRGTRFHTWLEQHWGTPQLVDPDELPGSADADAVPDADIEALQQAFLASEWATRVPVEIEVGFEALLGGRVVRGRVDAVFATGDGGLEVVDWKTGPPPPPELERVRAVQLAAYRVAFARLHDVPLDRVTAAFHHVREDHTVRPVDLLDEDALVELVAGLPETTAEG